MLHKIFFVILILVASSTGIAQIPIEGYIFENGNRGYIKDATVVLANESESEFYGKTQTDDSGKYIFNVTKSGRYKLIIEKKPFFEHRETIEVGESAGEILYFQHEINRKPGYIFEITLAEKDPDPNVPRSDLKGALIEVYNNTSKEEHLVIKSLENPNFQVNLIKGNHYTVLIRKEGFLAKRMEAFVDVEGCILCFEGVGEITPGISDNLTAANTMGTLLANVEMDKYFEGKVIGLNDIYYELDKSSLTSKAREELNKVARFLKDNPDISVELGSHTDSRGKSSYNLKLSKERAKSAVKYLVNVKNTPEKRIISKGYGESKLTNNCDDNSNCGEEEHAANRRTELKIIQIGNDFVFRSLRQMKAEELMDEILKDISEEGQIRIPDDPTSKTSSPSNMSQESIQEHAAAQKKEQRSKMESVKEPTKGVAEIETTIEEKTGKENISENISKDELNATDWIVHQAQPVKTEPGLSSKIIEDELSVSDGYKIVVLFSRFEISEDHPLFERFPEMEIYKTADGNRLYMIESYDNKILANARIQKRYKSAYPNAYVVGFKNGVMVD